jgi:type II secretory pathway pseudopilin PulG
MNRKNDNCTKFDLSAQTAIRSEQGHTLVEVMLAVSLLGFMVVSLYAGFTSGFAVLRVARENMRATQILEERMEVLRLVNWKNVTPGSIPMVFTAPFYATGNTNATAGSFGYTGTVSITNPPAENYNDHLRMIQIGLTWTSGSVTRSRQMTTYVSRYGLQNYLY